MASADFNYTAEMQLGVACGKECNKVLLRVIPALTAEFLVANFQVGHGTAGLALPVVAPEYLVAELFVRGGIKPQSWLLGPDAIHDAFPAGSPCNLCEEFGLMLRDDGTKLRCGNPYSRQPGGGLYGRKVR